MNEEAYYKEALRYLVDDMTAEERGAFEVFLQADPLRQRELETLRKLWTQTSLYDEEAPVTDIDNQWQRFRSQAFDGEAAQVIIKPWWKQLSRVAAVLLIVIGSLITWRIMQKPLGQNDQLLVTNVESTSKLVALPDGSQVWLNTKSEIRYDSNFDERRVALEGEAYFEVKHLNSEAAFRVIAGGSETKVLGTSFNVRAYADEEAVLVDVLEGRVAFGVSQNQEAVVLGKGSGARYMKTEQRFERTEAVASNVVAWKTGDLKFDDEALANVLEDLTRVFGAEFDVENPAALGCTFRSDFPDAKLIDVLEELEFTLNLTIEQNQINQHWIVSGTGCAIEQ